MKTKRLLMVLSFCLAWVTLFADQSASAIALGDSVQTTGSANVRPSPGGTPPYTNGQPSGAIGVVTSGPQNAQIGGTGTSYTWWYVDFSSGQDGWVASINLATIAGAAPNSPTNLVATGTASSIELSWSDNSSNETGFKLERKVGAGGSWALYATLGANGTTFSNTAVSAGVTYYYRVYSYNATGASTYYTNEASASLTAAVPNSPTNLIATGTASSIELSWSDNSNNETGFQLERKVGASGTWASYATLGANSTTFSNTVVTAGIIYYYRIYAYNATGASTYYTNEASASLTAAIPNSPTNLVATGTTSSIELSWSDNSNNETGFKLERKVGAGGTWALYQTLNANGTTFSNTSVTAGTTYYYRIYAYNATGASTYFTNEASASLTAAVPNSPTNLVASGSASSIALSWADNSNNETGFKLERKEGSGGTWTLYSTLAANTTAFSNTSVTAGTTYYYRVYAYNAAGPSTYFTNEASASASGSVPAAPTNLTAAGSASSVALVWRDNSTNETGFKVERKVGAGGTWALYTTLGSNVINFTDASVSLGTTYYYRVNSYNGVGASTSYSNEVSVAPSVGSDGYESDNAATSAKTIANGQTQNHSIHSAGDVDWAMFTVGSGGATGVTIETAGSSGDTELWLYGPNSSSTMVGYNDDGNGTFSRITLGNLAAGTYYIKVQAFGNNAVITAYTLRAAWTAVTPPASDGNETAATATDVTNGQTANAAISPVGDKDWYRFTVGSNGASNAIIETNGATGDTELWLYGANNATTQLGYNDDGNGLFSRISVASLTAGTYYIKVQAFGNNTTIAAYTLRATWTEVATASLGALVLQNAMSNEGHRSGSTYWGGKLFETNKFADSPPGTMTYCFRFARMCAGKAANGGDAVNEYRYFKDLGLINTGTNPPVGAVVFYVAGVDKGSKLGHAGIADGNGKIYSATSTTYGITWKDISVFTASTPYGGYVTAEVFRANYPAVISSKYFY